MESDLEKVREEIRKKQRGNATDEINIIIGN